MKTLFQSTNDIELNEYLFICSLEETTFAI